MYCILPELKYKKNLSTLVYFNLSEGNAEHTGPQEILCTHVVAASFTITERWKLPMCLWLEEWINKM
jgi:hypothetical protein